MEHLLVVIVLEIVLKRKQKWNLQQETIFSAKSIFGKEKQKTKGSNT